MDSLQLKRSVLTLAGYLGPNEAMTAEDAALSVQDLVARVCADANTSKTAMALIAVQVARYAEQRE